MKFNISDKTGRTIICPNCGAEIKSTAAACPECGSDERTGWSSSTYLDGIDLPDDDEYEEIAEKEFHGNGNKKHWWRSWMVLAGAALLLAILSGYAVNLFH